MRRPVLKISAIVGAIFLAVGALCMLAGKFVGGVIGGNYSFGNGNVIMAGNECISDTMELKPFTKLKIDTASIEVQLIHGDSYKLEMYAPKELMPEVTQDGGTLKIKQALLDKNISYMGINDWPYYIVTVPTSDLIDADINTTSGCIIVKDVNINGTLERTSGSTEVTGVNSDELMITSTSGSNNIENCQIKKLSMKSTSGSIELDDIESSAIDISTTSGSHELRNVRTDYLKTKSKSGSLDGDVIASGKIIIDSTSGSINLNLTGKASDYDYDINCVSGSIDIDDMSCSHEYSTNAGLDKSVNINTTSGSVNINF